MATKILDILKKGTVIPALPLALNEDKTLDEYSQKRLVHYYIDAGAGGIAAGVHTTQFEIRRPEFNLYEKVLRVTYNEIKKRNRLSDFIKVAGVCGETKQAISEANLAKEIGYDVALLSFVGLNHLSEEELLNHVQLIAAIMPIFGFYLQPAAGGRVLSYEFWRKFVEIPQVVAIKTAPFNRYQTLDVIRAIAYSSRYNDITVYTGNDDNIVPDLLTKYRFEVNGESREIQFAGGLLGHWSVDTHLAVKLFRHIKDKTLSIDELLSMGCAVTDCNRAYFDVANGFKGCIAGINDVLARQGLLKGNWCLLDKEVLSVGQATEITRVRNQYRWLCDDSFILENLEKWNQLAEKQ